MDAIWNSDWRVVPAIELMMVGVILVTLGLRSGHRFLVMPHGAAGRNLALMRGMRFVLGGGALLAIGAGWLWQLPVLVAAGAVIGFEETIETSIAASALAEEARRDAREEIQHG